ncbi:hypothetical protein B0T17DRAFT_221703 [Bombardia bombarda]|uniref:Uncharacterized protein n=1 Tax=Bombardia bombarda TaxID=252184 RepID=A0AA39XAQ2_9PEZI|nr:hypothetical protein B0T17DRAFT_221703 [Bombardia bombarda]
MLRKVIKVMWLGLACEPAYLNPRYLVPLLKVILMGKRRPGSLPRATEKSGDWNVKRKDAHSMLTTNTGQVCERSCWLAPSSEIAQALPSDPFGCWKTQNRGCGRVVVGAPPSEPTHPGFPAFT